MTLHRNPRARHMSLFAVSDQADLAQPMEAQQATGMARSGRGSAQHAVRRQARALTLGFCQRGGAAALHL